MKEPGMNAHDWDLMIASRKIGYFTRFPDYFCVNSLFARLIGSRTMRRDGTLPRTTRRIRFQSLLGLCMLERIGEKAQLVG